MLNCRPVFSQHYPFSPDIHPCTSGENDTDIQLRTSGCRNADLTEAANIAQLRLNAEFAMRQTSHY